VPMRAAGTVLGALGLFGTRVGELDEADLLVGRSLAHVASVAIVQEHPPTPAVVLPHLRSALASGVVVEQAKGFLRERLDVSIAEAFTLLRGYARSSGIHLTELARQLIGEPEVRAALLAALTEHAATR
jgi:ANTAR domain